MRAEPGADGNHWYVTDAQRSATLRIEADAPSTARWLACSAWYGAMPSDAGTEAHYGALEVLAVEDGHPG